MRFSFSPALPLGMEGREEYLEFRSPFQFSERELLDQVNLYLPEGIQLLRLEQLKVGEPAINELIAKMVYSVDLKNPRVVEVLQARAKESPRDTVQRIIEHWVKKLKEKSDDTIVNVSWDANQEKIFLTFCYPQRPSSRPQDIVGTVLGIEHPNFVMAREELVLKKT